MKCTNSSIEGIGIESNFRDKQQVGLQEVKNVFASYLDI
jgi:hypothetical protein